MVRNDLKDPDSAKFKWLPLIEGRTGYCGYVNAKNSFGGYTGDKLFYVLFSNKDGKIFAAEAVLGDGVGSRCSFYFNGS